MQKGPLSAICTPLLPRPLEPQRCDPAIYFVGGGSDPHTPGTRFGTWPQDVP
jgi:hypothetical protein